MIKKICVSSAIILMLVFSSQLSAAKLDIQFKGLFQAWFSYAPIASEDEDGYGFSLRRLRLAPYGSFSDTIKWGFQVAWDQQKASLLDAYLDFQFSPVFKIKVGQFPPPGTISAALTSSGKLDFLERPMITEKWNGHNLLTSYRALGIQAYGDLIEGKLYWAVMLTNPSAADLFTPRVSSANYSHELNGITLWGRMEAKPVKGMSIGVFASTGKSNVYDELVDYKTSTYGAHFFYTAKPINFKAEYIAGEYGFENSETKYNGYYILLGYTIGKLEPIVQYDSYVPNVDSSDNMSIERYNNFILGLNYFLNDNVKLQANYVMRDESIEGFIEKLDNNIFYLCFQYSF
jgi:phosphate-selective porin